MWKATTRFIVDSYHYINHCTTDYLCRTWCNPAPLNGSQPNLIDVAYDKHGNPHYKHAFNTQVSCYIFTKKYTYIDVQACEQLNAWIGGFQSILNRMTIGNFDWFLHTMLFLHTERVIGKQGERQKITEEEEEEEDDDDDDGVNIYREDQFI